MRGKADSVENQYGVAHKLQGNIYYFFAVVNFHVFFLLLCLYLNIFKGNEAGDPKRRYFS